MSRDTILQISTIMRRRAEAFARLKGYDAETLVTMCSTVSAGLVLALRWAGFSVDMVVGKCDGADHFWVDVHEPRLLVDLTATQFDDPGLPPVVVSVYTEHPGTLYKVGARDQSVVWDSIRDHDLADVVEFEGCTMEWLRKRGKPVLGPGVTTLWTGGAA